VQPLLSLSILATFLEKGENLAQMMGINTPSTRPTERRRRRNTRHAQSGKRKPARVLPSVPIADPSRANGTGQWPHWPDPLDFQEVPEDEAIARLNAAGYFVLTHNGDIYKIGPSGVISVQKPGGFANLFACRQALGNDGKLISAGTAWKRSREHREYRSIGYWPGDRGRPAESYNLWRGWGIEPKQGDWSIIRDHIINVISDGDKDKADYILDWCAHMVQRPWEKPGVALVLKGRMGTGKTLFTQMLARVVGMQNTLITANGKKLFAQFNWHLADKMLIGAEEAFFGRSRELSDQLKHLLTGDEIELEQKFGQRISMKSMHRRLSRQTTSRLLRHQKTSGGSLCATYRINDAKTMITLSRSSASSRAKTMCHLPRSCMNSRRATSQTGNPNRLLVTQQLLILSGKNR
jgi:hypothetical protein